VQSRGFPIGGRDGVQRSVGVVRDVSHERALDQALRHAQKMEAVGTLASGVAHNLRNVLQTIVNFIEVSRMLTAAGEPTTEMLDRAMTAATSGATLIDQLMTFARKQEAVPLSSVRLDDVLRDAMAMIKPLVSEAISLKIDVGAPDGVVMAHPVQLQQILLNLATNARDAMPRGGTLSITSREVALDEPFASAHGLSAGRHLVVTVKDTGEGMDAATKARMFDPFFTTKDIGRGTGLGLSTVFALVQQFGGCIEVDSAPAVGTTFTIYLPAQRGQGANGHSGT
jgi:signal transduction histidine kinase